MDYPHKTFLLDDGNRAEMKSLAEKLGVGYIAREKNTGAKAGNLNNAMQYTQGELIAIFDADFRPEKDFLNRLAGYFQDAKVAVVQTPQYYYNTDSFQHRRLSGDEIYSDQDAFMHLTLPARNNWNAAYWIGTNSLLRRNVIESIGGFPTDCVTEDILASMLIHGKGWKTIYINEPLAYGLAPANISEYFVQRLRWAKGAFQILRSHNPLFQRGLSLMQRLFYFSSVSHFNIRFRVTPKDSKTTISLQGTVGPAIILGFNSVAIVMAISKLSTVASLGILGWIVFGWCLYVGSIAFLSCYYCFKPLIKKVK
jgi:cellulose synthase (UDP-forming)